MRGNERPSVLTAVCLADGLRWMFKHQTDVKKQMAFMSGVIYPPNKGCRAPPAEFMALDTRNGLSGLSLDLWPGPMVLSQKKEAWNISIILKGFRILGRNWVSFSKMVLLSGNTARLDGKKTIKDEVVEAVAHFHSQCENVQFNFSANLSDV